MTARSDLTIYLESISHYPTGEGDGSRDALVQGHLRLVVWRANRFKLPRGVNRMDVISIGNEALVAVAEKYDRSRGTKFSTLATVSVDRAIINYLNAGISGAIRVPPIHLGNPGSNRLLALGAKARNCKELSENLPDKAETPFDAMARAADARSAHNRLAPLIAAIDKRSREILLGRAAGRKLRDLADAHGVSVERIRQIEREGLRKLRNRAGVA